MAEMGKYCKAYYAKDFKPLPGWDPKIENLRPDKKEEKGEEIEIPRTELKDDDILYLQEDYTVTDGIFKDEHVVFDQVTDEWKKACEEQLNFEIPVYEPIDIQTEDGDGGGDGDGDSGEGGGGDG